MYVAFGKSEKVLDVNIGLFLAVVPGTTTFIDRVPTAATVESHVHVPALSLVQLHDEGPVAPDSKDPLAKILETVAGNSRYRKPDPIPDDAYSNPPD